MVDETGQSGIWTNPDGVGASKNDDAVAQSEQIAVLKNELQRLRQAIEQIASGTTQIASAEFKELASAAEDKLKQNVFLSVAVAAVIGYLWGRSGR